MASTSTVEPSLGMEEYTNWLEMPDELMTYIFQRLSSKEILNSTWKVCTTWRRICKDPAMWQVIDMLKPPDGCGPRYYIKLLKQAVHLSCGELLDIRIRGWAFCTDHLLNHILLRSSKLKHLCLRDCFRMTGSGLSRAIKRVPQLEKLDLSYIYISAEDIEVIGRNCPQLKSVTMADMITSGPFLGYDNLAVPIGNSMPELRHLLIDGNFMTNTGVQGILNGCPHLESLQIYMYYCSFKLDGNLVNMCMERIKDFKHNATQNSDDSDDFCYELL